MNLTETHWQLLELAREEPLMLAEDPDAIEELVAAGLLAKDEGELIDLTLYPLTDAGRAVLARGRP
jgi:hypothetical protein